MIDRSLPRRTAARRAALFFGVAGVLAIVNSVLLPAAHTHELLFIALGLLDLAITVVLWLLPWHRWSARALLGIVPLAFVVIGLFYHVGATPLLIYPVFFILLFIWVGLSLPPWTSLLLTPLTAAAYVIPLRWPGPEAAPINSALVVVPVCTLVGEVIAHVMHQLHIAQDLLEREVAERTSELRAANTALQHELVERKQIEAALAAERAALAWQVEERTGDLRTANAELTHATRLKDEFLASMSHELRTPLNTILGMTEIRQEGIYGAVSDQQTDALGHIEESGRHLLALINDILDLSKIEAGKLDLNVEDVELVVVAQASLRLISQMARQKNLRIVSSIDSCVGMLQADARRLKPMLVNLLSNAVKFTPEGGTIGLDVVGDATAQRVHLTVWDTGIGIAANDLPRLFQPFVQLDSRLARQYVGTGLGLALVQRMAALHGGSVAVESTLGQGSRFTITLPWTTALPLSEIVGPIDRDEPSEVRDAPMQRALVIEDTPTAAAQLARYLRELGVEASVHPKGAGVLEAALEVCPDVILLDIQLPDRSGWDVLSQLKADERVRSIPILVVSVVDDRPQGMARGAVAYLIKPIARQQLQEALNTIQSGGMSHTGPTALIVAPDQPQGPAAPVILLAEDEENNIYTLSTYLAAKGYQVIVARNGAEAVERAQDAAPALILMDIQMPGLDGLEAIRRIRADTMLATVPIIALTALVMPGDRERCLNAGADDYLSKPVSLKALINTIEAYLHRPAASWEPNHDPHEHHPDRG